MNQKFAGIICYCSQQAESEYTNKAIEASQYQAFRGGGVSYCRFNALTKPDPGLWRGCLAALSHCFLQTCFYFLVLFSYE